MSAQLEVDKLICKEFPEIPKKYREKYHGQTGIHKMWQKICNQCPMDPIIMLTEKIKIIKG